MCTEGPSCLDKGLDRMRAAKTVQCFEGKKERRLQMLQDVVRGWMAGGVVDVQKKG